MSMLGIIMIFVAVVLILLQIYANRKQKAIDKIRELVYTPLINYKDSELKEASILGAGAVGLNLLDIYSSIDKHEEVLNVLEERFPNKLSDFNSIDWFNKISELMDRGEKSVETYISAFKGQQAENIALELLRENGLNAELFETLNHPNDDIKVILDDGTEKAISVKCGSADYIKQSIENHPESTNYIINAEAYDEMDAKGLIDYYENNGIYIENGMYYNEDLTNQAINAIDDIGDNDIADNIPFVAIGIFLVKSGINIHKYNKNKQTGYELKVNLATDGVKAFAGGAFAVVGAKAGGIMGGFFVPGIGNLIGGGIGAFAGGLISGKTFNFIKEKIKWGDIIESIEYYGEKYEHSISDNMKRNICFELFDTDSDIIQNMINAELEISKNYKRSLNPYSIKKISVPAVLSSEYINNLKIYLNKLEKSIEQSQEEIFRNIEQLVSECNIDNRKKQNKIKLRYLGEIILSNSWMLKGETLSNHEIDMLNKYEYKIEIAENHPYRISDSYNFVKTIVYSTFNKVEATKKTKCMTYYKYIIYSLSAILIIMGFGLI